MSYSRKGERVDMTKSKKANRKNTSVRKAKILLQVSINSSTPYVISIKNSYINYGSKYGGILQGTNSRKKTVR
jgi:hypothetical protein